jgi:hypothetical protein
MTRSRILGAIGLVWGSGVLISRAMAHEAAVADGAYAAGQSAGLVVVRSSRSGLCYLVKGSCPL